MRRPLAERLLALRVVKGAAEAAICLGEMWLRCCCVTADLAAMDVAVVAGDDKWLRLRVLRDEGCVFFWAYEYSDGVVAVVVTLM